jgi:hypothetical protein
LPKKIIHGQEAKREKRPSKNWEAKLGKRPNKNWDEHSILCWSSRGKKISYLVDMGLNILFEEHGRVDPKARSMQDMQIIDPPGTSPLFR